LGLAIKAALPGQHQRLASHRLAVKQLVSERLYHEHATGKTGAPWSLVDFQPVIQAVEA